MQLQATDELYGTHDFLVSDYARRTIRMNFNPSQLPQVDRLKLLAAAFLSEVEKQVTEGDPSVPDLREWAEARVHIQTACMFAVAAATAHLVK